MSKYCWSEKAPLCTAEVLMLLHTATALMDDPEENALHPLFPRLLRVYLGIFNRQRHRNISDTVKKQ